MLAVVQRVTSGKVEVGGRTVGRIGVGLLVLIGVHAADAPADAVWIAERLLGLRIFSDAEGKMNLSANQIGGGLLLISQFTLCASTGKGNRPGFENAMKPPMAKELFDLVISTARMPRPPLMTPAGGVAEGVFGADMQVTLTNDGPVTVMLNSHEHLPRG